MAASTSKAKGSAPATVRVIPRSEVRKAKRGRKAKVDQSLLAALAEIPTDGESAGVLDSFAGTEKAKQPTVGSTIRNHWEMIHGKHKDADGNLTGNPAPRVEWDTETGTPQVSARF